MRLIDADALKEALHKAPTVIGHPYFKGRTVYECISNAPTIDTVRHGRWIVGDSLPMHDIAGNLSWGNWYTCNQCEFKTYAIEHHITQYNYCPNCGAKMDEEE